MSIDLEALGMTQEELQNRVINAMVARLFTAGGSDDEGNYYGRDSEFKQQLDKTVREHVDATLNVLAEKYIAPNVAEMIEGMVLVQTNKWGERKGSPVTFTEYLTDRAEVWLREQVSYQGKSKEEEGGSYFRPYGTRIAYMIDQHLAFSIKNAMEAATKNANEAIAGGITEAVKISLANIVTSLKVTTEVKSK